MGPEGWHDAPWLAAREASMGGCFLLLAARARPALFRSLALPCPANGASLLAGLDEMETLEGAGDPDREYYGHFDAVSLRPFLRGLDLVDAAHGLPRVLLAVAAGGARDARLGEGARGLRAPASPHGLRWATIRGGGPATLESA